MNGADRFLKVPVALRERPHWLLHDVHRTPHYTSGSLRRGTQGGSADLALLATYEAAVGALAGFGDRFAGLGIAVLGDGLVALDFDYKAHTRNPLSDEEVMELCAGTYVERSPGGLGRRAFFWGTMQKITANGGALRGIEAFPSGQFVTVTGNQIAGSADTIADLPEGLEATLLELAGVQRRDAKPRGEASVKARLKLTIGAAREVLEALPNWFWNDYWRWLYAGMALNHQFEGSAEALALWRDQSARATDPTAYEDDAFDKKWPTFGRDGWTFWYIIDELRKHDPEKAQSFVNLLASIEFADPEQTRDPEDLSEFDLPAFPRAAEYGVLHDIIEAATATSEATRPGVAAATMAQFAARYGLAMGLDVGDERRTLTFYVLVVGRTATGRKGTSAALAETLFEDVDLMLEEGWGEDLLGDTGYVQVPVPRLRVLTNVSSGQGVIDAVRDETIVVSRNGIQNVVPGIEDKRMLLSMSEFGTVFSMAAQEANTLTAVLRDAFDGRALQTNTKNNKVSATGAHVCILGHITKTEFLAKTVHNPRSTEIRNGMLNRMAVMYSQVEKLVPRPVAVPVETRRALAARLATNVARVFDACPSNHRSRRTVVFDMTVDAWSLWDDAYRRMQNRLHANEIAESMLARLPLITRTIAALLAAMNGERIVGASALTAALAWSDYILQSNTKVFVTLAERQRADLLRVDIDRIRTKLELKGGTMELRDIKRTFSNSAFSPARQSAAIEAMQSSTPPQIEVKGKFVRLLV